MNLWIPILVPLLAGLLGFLITRLRNELSFIGSVLTLYYAGRIFLATRSATLVQEITEIGGRGIGFWVDPLSGLILLGNSFFGLIALLYSFRYMRRYSGLGGYYLCLFLTLAGANGVALSGNLMLLLGFWSFLVAVLYGILLIGKPGSSGAAHKAFIIVGSSDFAMLLGIVLLFARTGQLGIISQPRVGLEDPWLVAPFLLLCVGALAKAGAMPLHTWIPEASKVAPASTMAYIPAALDKLLGIYLLVRVSVYIFDLPSSMTLRIVLMSVGAVTILAAVGMALVQHEAMRLLSFHAVSQVGYMVLGVGTGVPVGIAGGLFHMINNAVYKSCLFLSVGSVEDRARTTELDRLGGLARQMPITLFSFLIAALAISGVPPLSGFASKWMVYQGVLELSREGSVVWPLFLIAAMLGSVLTLASFLKLLHSIFLGDRPRGLERVREPGFSMWLPTLLLALLCIGFGVFAYELPLRHLIYPGLPFGVGLVGLWSPTLATGLILLGVALGLVGYWVGTAFQPRRRHIFVGGEELDPEEFRITGPHFYSSIRSIEILDKTYQFGEGGSFDLYNHFIGMLRALGSIFKVLDRGIDGFYQLVARLTNWVGSGLSGLHSGLLSRYLAWILIGALIFWLMLW